MKRIITDKDVLSVDDIKEFIKMYEADYIPKYNTLWAYFQGKNKAILDKKSPDPNNPDNRTPVPYAKKIITTFTGYAYRPRYITYKSEDEQYMNVLQSTFDDNNEHIKTSMHGRNTGIFGVSYELLYIDGDKTAEPKFAVVDPREIILIYDNQIEPKKHSAIRYYKTATSDNGDTYDVIVYTKSGTEYYTMKKDRANNIDSLMLIGAEPNYFDGLPITAYYLGDQIQGLIEPVLPLIDDYDLLISDSMNEFDRFAHAYMRLVGMSLSGFANSKEPGAINRALKLIKRRRIFEQLPEKDAVTFLTKDIPTDYIRYMSELVREQIHNQSHVPDLNGSAFKDGVSGVAVQRLMFDFENVVSTAEAEFDVGLMDRITLINSILKKTGQPIGDAFDVTISHKRNAPLNLKEFADTSLTMKQAGFSRWLVADVMPDDVVPNVEQELERQDEDIESMMLDVESMPETDEVE
jgi:SPP1 family phage portal protein